VAFAASRSVPRSATRRTLPTKSSTYNSMPRRLRALGVRLHLCQHLVRFCLCCFRHRHLRSPDCGLGFRSESPHRLCARCVGAGSPRLATVHHVGLVHHSDRGSQDVSVRYGQCLATAGIEPSVSSVGKTYDNALDETTSGLYKAEVIHRCGPLAIV
jgi:transposase InsO family protein